MALKYRTRGIVIAKEEKSEFDKLFYIFSEDFGKISVRAKAIRKINSKLKYGIDLFYFSEIEFIEGKNYKTLTDAVLIEKNDDILNDYKKTEIVFNIIDILNNFIKGQNKDEATFVLLRDIIKKINSVAMHKNYEFLYYYFIWNFLSNQGYGPEVSKCVLCKIKLNPYNIFFSYQDGGVICKSCAISEKNTLKINSDVIKILRIILNKDWQIISKLKIGSKSQQLFQKVSDTAIKNFCPA